MKLEQEIKRRRGSWMKFFHDEFPVSANYFYHRNVSKLCRAIGNAVTILEVERPVIIDIIYKKLDSVRNQCTVNVLKRAQIYIYIRIRYTRRKSKYIIARKWLFANLNCANVRVISDDRRDTRRISTHISRRYGNRIGCIGTRYFHARLYARARAYTRRHWNIDLKNEWKRRKEGKRKKTRKGNLEVRARGRSRYENKYSLCMLMHEEWNSRRCLSVGNSSFSIGLGSGWSELAFNERGWTSSRLVAAVAGRGHANESNRRYRNLVPPCLIRDYNRGGSGASYSIDTSGPKESIPTEKADRGRGGCHRWFTLDQTPR